MDFWIDNVRYTIEDCDTKTILDLLRKILDKGVSVYSSDLDSRLSDAESKIKELTYAANFSGIGSYLQNTELDWWLQRSTTEPVWCFGDGSTNATIDNYTYVIFTFEVASTKKYYISFRPSADDTALLKPATPINITLPQPYGTLPIYFVKLPYSAIDSHLYLGALMEPSPFIAADTVDNITYDKIANIGYTAGLTAVSDVSLFLPVIYRSSDLGINKFRIIGNKIDVDTNTLEYYPLPSTFIFKL